MKNQTTPYIIKKEDISKLKFSKTETLINPKKRELRTHYLNRASQLGNLLKTKVKIHFRDSTNKLLIVNTTIWAVTSNFIVLKKGVTIPKSSIIYIE